MAVNKQFSYGQIMQQFRRSEQALVKGVQGIHACMQWLNQQQQAVPTGASAGVTQRRGRGTRSRQGGTTTGATTTGGTRRRASRKRTSQTNILAGLPNI